ncbi:MAG: 23S rRNA (uracil(1939)-C(5))-methyltransferase RlmD [Merismopediaceae bacterium]|nr:23S rRNA (uracil(1939)-C(5))-methyltransferase RlmD [Merismopediaceae bacterium]
MTLEHSPWQQGAIIPLEITGLNHSGEGLGRYQERVVFVPDAVPGDRLLVRLIHLKAQYGQGQIQEILHPSEHRIRPACIVADKCGGCQWQHIDYAYQVQSKQQQIMDALTRIGGFAELPIAPLLIPDQSLAYRNKVTYPLARSSQGQVQAGYYRRHSHHLINLNQCPVQEVAFNPLLKEIKRDIQDQGWSIYNEQERRGKLRHLSLRLGRRTGEMLLTLISTSPNLPNLKKQAEIWLERYPHLVGVALNLQPEPNNVIFGPETRAIAGQTSCREIFADLQFDLRPDTFFQVHTEAAEALLELLRQQLSLTGQEVLLDAYCGVGTFTLPLAQRVKTAIGLEIHPQAVEQAMQNAQLNQITNVTFHAGRVEDLLPQLTEHPDIVLLDPPRKGCDRRVLETLKQLSPAQIGYISCQPSTLARDLKTLCEDQTYQIHWIQGADFFPQTAHVECAVILNRR